jgi:hypothetical protein
VSGLEGQSASVGRPLDAKGLADRGRRYPPKTGKSPARAGRLYLRGSPHCGCLHSFSGKEWVSLAHHRCWRMAKRYKLCRWIRSKGETI